MRILDPLFPAKLARLLQSKGTHLQAPTEAGVLGVVISIPADAVLERGGGRALAVNRLPDPAAGAGLTLVNGTEELWHPISLRFTLQTEVTAGMREVILAFDDGDATNGTYSETITTQEQAASLLFAYNFAQGLPREIDTSITRVQTSMPRELTLSNGHRMRIVVNNIKAADQIADAVLLYSVG